MGCPSILQIVMFLISLGINEGRLHMCMILVCLFLSRREADQRKYASEMMDDVITLDLRTNQEKLEYLSVPSDYR